MKCCPSFIIRCINVRSILDQWHDNPVIAWKRWVFYFVHKCSIIFSWNTIHGCQMQCRPSFFVGKIDVSTVFDEHNSDLITIYKNIKHNRYCLIWLNISIFKSLFSMAHCNGVFPKLSAWFISARFCMSQSRILSFPMSFESILWFFSLRYLERNATNLFEQLSSKGFFLLHQQDSHLLHSGLKGV